MKNENIIIIFFVLVCFILIVLIIKFLIKEPSKQNYNGVCAFDLDDTITCGIEQAKIAINTCKKNNYKIAIITARPQQYYSDIKLDALGLIEEDFIDDFYHGDKHECSFIDKNCLMDSIAETKVKQLYELSKKYNLDPSKIIFFDDQLKNIENAKINGFYTVHANNPSCGLPIDIYDKLSNIF